MTKRRLPAPPDIVLLAEFVRVIDYDPRTGSMRWREDSRGHKAGEEAGHSDGRYRSLMLLGQRFKTHRIIWLFHYGYMPAGEIDHINGVRTDNRIENLRAATRAQNTQNRVKNGSLPTGVSKNERGRYCARIQAPGAPTKIYLGYYDTPELAAAAYAGASIVLYGEYAPKLSRAA